MDYNRKNDIEMSAAEFKETGYQLVDTIAAFIEDIKNKPVTTGESPSKIRSLLGEGTFPDNGTPAKEILARSADILINHSLFNGHPKFLGYITSSAAPIGALADLLASTINPNTGANILSPVATEIEKQTIEWLSEFIGIDPGYGGIMVSGGNMANFTAFLAARTVKAPKDLKAKGVENHTERMTIYCSKTTHTWIEKAAILFGNGTDSIRWIITDAKNKMDNNELEKAIQQDISAGHKPFMIVGTAGDVSTGVVDELDILSKIAVKYNLWFHIDGAYGIPAAILPELSDVFEGIKQADSIALDPHKWLYNPLEAGCTLVKNPNHLLTTFSSHPEYYNFSKTGEDVSHNFYEYGLQNSRGFRALKVWVTLQQVGRKGYEKMIREDIELSKLMYQMAEQHPELEAVTQSLSITTLRYVPQQLQDNLEQHLDDLNELNKALLDALQINGEVFLSNAIVEGKYCLRGCIVNFRTTKKDIEEIIAIIATEGKKIHQKLGKVES